MKRIAILTCLRANDVCAGCSCLSALYERRGAFARYAGEDVRLTAFMRCSACRRDGGEPDSGEIEKLDRLAQEGTEAVHVGVCALDRASGDMCPGMRHLAEECRARGMEVVLRTH